MAEKTVLVCDVCGGLAYTQRPLDVCKEHTKTPLRVLVSHEGGRAAPRPYRFVPVKCDKCGQVFKAGQGAAVHARRSHNWNPGSKPLWSKIGEG